MFRLLQAAAEKAKSLVGDDKANELPPPGAPDYMQTGSSELTAAYGDEVSARVFSDEFTDVRWNAIASTILDDAQWTWGMYDLYPHKNEKGEIGWIEHYSIRGENDCRRHLFMSLIDGEVHVAHLVPGETLTSPVLQCDTINTVLPLVLNEGPANGSDDFVLDAQLLERGIPDVWPKGGGATLTDTIVIQAPEGQDSGWQERWGFVTGGELVVVDIQFVTVPDGGTLIYPTVHREQQ